MNAMSRTGIVLFLALGLCNLALAAEADLRDALQPPRIDAVQIHLNPAGAGLGFETRIAGNDPRLSALIDVVRAAEPGGGHKCPNAGSIRFRMRDGGIIGVGLLPGHTAGIYELRLYDGERLLGAYRVNRTALLAALAELDVPVDDPAFRE